MFVPVVCLHVLFVVTYPLNSLGGDAGNYRAMIVEGRSSLVHAGGYPFLVGLAFRHEPLSTMFAGHPERLDELLQWIQHAISLATTAVLFQFTRRIFGALVAVLTVFSLATSLEMLGATSSTYPEWLQSALFVLAGSCAGWAFLARDGGRKSLLYAASVTAFTWCVLVKFNAAVLGGMYLLPLLAERRRALTKIVFVAGCLLLAAVNVVVYVSTFHQPTTGTRRLTADSGWVLLTRTQQVLNNELSPSNGPNTKRWLVLASMLPKNYGVAGPQMFWHVNAVADDVRAPYRALFDAITSSDERSIDARLRDRRLPEGFSVGMSVIPVCYYVGLLEGSDLGTAVAFEAVVANPRPFLSTLVHDVRYVLQTPTQGGLFPLTQNMHVYGLKNGERLPGGWISFEQQAVASMNPYSYHEAIFWEPGLHLFAQLAEWWVPPRWPAALIVFVVAITSLRVGLARRFDAQSAITLMAGISLVLLILASCLTLQFRWKELILAMPSVALLTSVGAAEIVRGMAAVVRKVTSS